MEDSLLQGPEWRDPSALSPCCCGRVRGPHVQLHKGDILMPQSGLPCVIEFRGMCDGTPSWCRVHSEWPHFAVNVPQQTLSEMRWFAVNGLTVFFLAHPGCLEKHSADSVGYSLWSSHPAYPVVTSKKVRWRSLIWSPPCMKSVEFTLCYCVLDSAMWFATVAYLHSSAESYVCRGIFTNGDKNHQETAREEIASCKGREISPQWYEIGIDFI